MEAEVRTEEGGRVSETKLSIMQIKLMEFITTGKVPGGHVGGESRIKCHFWFLPA